MVSGRTNISAEDIFYSFVTNMSSLTASCRKLLLKRKRSSLDNEMPSCTRCVAFGITDCETVEGSSRCRGCIAVGRSC